MTLVYCQSIHYETPLCVCMYSLWQMVVDKWELNHTDVELMKDQPLGKGAFGEVYKGIVHRSAAKQNRKISSATNVVAIKMLKSLFTHILFYIYTQVP